MKRFFVGIAATFILAALAPLALSDTKSGPIELRELKPQEVRDKAVKVHLGNKVKAECTFFINPNFFGKKVISVQAQVRNTSDKALYFGYYVAFFDRDKNLIACSSFAGSRIARLQPGKQKFIGNVVSIPLRDLQRIASYQVTVLEDEKEFGR